MACLLLNFCTFLAHFRYIFSTDLLTSTFFLWPTKNSKINLDLTSLQVFTFFTENLWQISVSCYHQTLINFCEKWCIFGAFPNHSYTNSHRDTKAICGFTRSKKSNHKNLLRALAECTTWVEMWIFPDFDPPRRPLGAGDDPRPRLCI